jgi:uncharacterized protein (UPF0261 family)
MKNKQQALNTVALALFSTIVLAGPVLAQVTVGGGTDVIGVSPIANDAIVAFKGIALAAIGLGFLALMSGRHTMAALVALGVGGLGLAKIQAIVTLFGF